MPGARPAFAAGGVRPRGCGRYGARVPADWCGCWLRCFDRRGPVACGCCISLLPAVSAVSALFIAAAVSSHRRKGPVFSPHLGRTRGVRPPFLPGGIVCPAPKKETRHAARLFFCDYPQVLLSALPHIARKGECEGGTFDGFPHSRSVTRPQATTFA